MDDRDLHRAKYAVGFCAASVFVCWETFKHLFLMNVPMFTLHLVSTVVETAAAVGVTALGIHLLGMVAEARRSQASFGQIVGAALGTSVTLKAALRDIRGVADALDEEQPLAGYSAASRAALLRDRVREVEHVMRTLSALSTETPSAGAPQLLSREAHEVPRRPAPTSDPQPAVSLPMH